MPTKPSFPPGHNSRRTCACGAPATWLLIHFKEEIPLCQECYQLESLSHPHDRFNDLLSDQIHTCWLIYPSPNPFLTRSDAAG